DVLEAQALGPVVHYKRVVDADAVDVVHTELPHLLVSQVKGRALPIGAGRSERARQRKDDDPLAAEQVAAIDILPAIGVRSGDAFVAHTGLEHSVRNGTALHWTL